MSGNSYMYHVRVVIGENFRKARESKGILLREVAYYVGCDVPYVCGVESGRRSLSIKRLCVLAESVGATPSELMRGV